jgi:TPR repeat protein
VSGTDNAEVETVKGCNSMKNLTATICLTIAVLLGSAGLSWSASIKEGVEALSKGKCSLAQRNLDPLVAQGNPIAAWAVGLMYVGGLCKPKDEDAAKIYFQSAAGKTYGRALIQLSSIALERDEFETAYMWAYLAKDLFPNKRAVTKELRNKSVDDWAPRDWYVFKGSLARSLLTLMEEKPLVDYGQIQNAKRRAKICRANDFQRCD